MSHPALLSFAATPRLLSKARSSTWILALPCLATVGLAQGMPPYFDSAWRAFDTAPISASSSQYLTGLAAADLNGDGLPDVVGSQWFQSGGLRVLLNQGSAAGRPATFGPATYYPTAYETPNVFIADLDGDGDPDLAATATNDYYKTGSFVAVLRNDGTGAFSTPAYYGAGPHGPLGIEGADFDGDGDVDLAAANYGLGNGTTVSILVNGGNATFAAPVSYAAGANEVYKLDTGDVDGDGDFDLAVAHDAVYVSILFNDGGAFDSFDAYAVGPTNGSYADVALFDPDGDGDLDAAYTFSHISNSFVLLRNDGTGDFAPETIPYGFTSNVASDLFTADFNGDGYDDVGGPQMWEAGFVVLLADGAGGFLPGVVYAGSGNFQGNSHAGAVADLDLDGDPDVLTANRFAPLITAHENLGDGTFPLRPIYVSSYSSGSLDAGDVNGDGKLDVAISHTGYSAASVGVLTGFGDGSFVESYETPQGIYGFARLCDLNGDGFDDLLMVSGRAAPPYDFFTALSNGNGTFQAVIRWPLGACGVAYPSAFDVDGDGDLDVITAEDGACFGNLNSGKRLFVSLGNGNGTFQAPYTIKTGSKPYYVESGDFNEDGKLDLVVSGSEALHLGNGDGTFQPWQPLPGTVNGLHGNLVAADFDGDGHTDVAAYEGDGATQTWLSMFWGDGTGAFVTSDHGIHAGTFHDEWLATGDVDGDGDLDVMINGMGDVLVLVNDGGRAFTYSGRYGIGEETRAPYHADFDNDGIGDLVAVVARPPPGPAAGGVAFVQGLRPDGIEAYCHCASGAPCGNTSAAAGCANSTGAGGALSASGSTSVSADDLVLSATQLPPNVNGILFMGSKQIGPLAFNSGLLCVGGGSSGLLRFPVQNAGPMGQLVQGPIVAHSHAHFAPGAQIAAGQVWNFQAWYRDPSGPCGHASNLTSALSITFVP